VNTAAKRRRLSRPRYRVGSVTGYANSRREATLWYVQDSVYCFRTVRSFGCSPTAERNARQLADILNADVVELCCRTCGKPYEPPLIGRPGAYYLSAYCSVSCRQSRASNQRWEHAKKGENP